MRCLWCLCRKEVRGFASQVYAEVSALKQGAAHAHLGALAIPLEFNGFLPHLLSGAPLTPRGFPVGGPPTPRGASAGGWQTPRGHPYTRGPSTPRGPPTEPYEAPRPYPLPTPEAAGASLAAAVAALGAPQSDDPRQRGGPLGGLFRGPPHYRRSASVGVPRRGAPSPPRSRRREGPPRSLLGAPSEGASDADSLLLHSCRSSNSEEEGPYMRGLAGAPSGSPSFGRAPTYPGRLQQGASEASRPLRRPSPPSRGPPLLLPTAYMSTAFPGAPPQGGPLSWGAPQQTAEDYRLLADEAREALEEARRNLLRRRGLGP